MQIITKCYFRADQYNGYFNLNMTFHQHSSKVKLPQDSWQKPVAMLLQEVMCQSLCINSAASCSWITQRGCAWRQVNYKAVLAFSWATVTTCPNNIPPWSREQFALRRMVNVPTSKDQRFLFSMCKQEPGSYLFIINSTFSFLCLAKLKGYHLNICKLLLLGMWMH